jgi:hypothetical protein
VSAERRAARPVLVALNVSAADFVLAEGMSSCSRKWFVGLSIILTLHYG